MTISLLSPEAVENMKPFYIGRNEPNYSWMTSVGSRLFMPGITGLWPGSIQGNGVTPDLTGNAQTMTLNTSTLTNIGMAPCFSIPNTTSYLNTADAVVNSPTTVFYFSCWIRITTLTAAAVGNGIANKWGGAGNRSWRLHLNASNQVSFEISSNGTTSASIQNTNAIIVNTWYRVTASLIAGGGASTYYLWVNETVASGAGVTTVFDGTADLELGRATGGGSDGLRGYLSLPTFGIYAMPEIYFDTAYQYEKAIYGYN